MKNNKSFSIRVAWLIAVLIVLLYTGVGSATKASDIKIYTQNDYNNSQWALAGESGRNLKKAGCALFSYAHAIEWLTETMRGNDLLSELIGVCNDPNGLRGHPDCTHTNLKDVYALAYRKYIKEKYDIEDDTVSKTEAAIKKYLDAGGVIVLRGPSSGGGHIALAVEFAYDGTGKGFIHIVDSHPYSFHNSSLKIKYYDKHSDGTFKAWTSYTQRGADYWIRCSDVVNNGSFNLWNGLRIIKKTPPTSIELNTTSSVIYLPAETLSLKATAYPSDASQAVVWKSSDTSVATVSAAGVVTPQGLGTTTITATSAADASIKAECTVTVKYNGTGSISFNRVLFPYNYKITSSGFDWEAGSGTITSDVALDKVVFTVYHPDNTVKTYTKSNIGAKSLSMESVSSLIKFSAISTAGEGYFQIAATDILGRTLAAGRIFTASKSSGYSDSSDLPESFYYRINVTYTDPVLTDTAVYNGSTYQLYKASYTWNEAKAYAESIGGHLATITSSAENTAIYNMVKKRDVGAWIGCTSASGSWKWVTGEPWTYSNWRSGDPNNQWGQEFYGAMRITEGAWLDSCSTNANWGFFVVEFDPAKVERIVLEGESAPMVGDQFTLTANVLPYNATLKTVKCTSTNTAIATVDATTGLVKAVGEGTCNIVATAQDGSGVTGIFTVHVQPKAIPVTGITLKASSELYSSSNTITVKVGESFEVWAEITPSNADNTMAEFYTTDISIAEVGDYSNAVTAIAPGKCKIVAVSDENSEITHSLELVVTEDGGVEITNLSCAEGDVYQGTDIPLEGVVRVTGGATQLTYLELMLTNLDTGSEEYFDIDLYNAQPTEYDLSTLDFSNTANPKNLEPAEYDLMIKAWYMTANGDEEYKTTYVSFRVLEKQGETPEPGDVGELTYSNLKQPEGAVIQQGDVIPMSGTVSVTGGAKYLSAIRTTLYKVAGSDGNGEEYLVKYGNLYSDLSDTKPTRYELASEIEWYDTTYDEPGTYFIIMEIAFIGGNGEEIWDGFMPSGRFTIEGKDPGTVTVTGIQSPSGYFTEGTDYPLAGTLKVEGGAQYITSVYACVHNYDEYFETYEADYAGTKPTRLDISQLSFVEKLNIRNLVPGEYFLYMDVSYIDANGELNNRIIINDKVTILSKTPVNPGTITVEDLSYPSGEVVEGTIWPLNGVIKVKDGAQYIACIYGELYKNGTLLEALETDWLLEEEVAIYNLDKLGFSFRVSPDELKIGEYSLRVWVDFIDASGEWISYGDIVDTRYTIIADPDPTPYPGGIKVTNFGIEQQEVYPGQPMPLTGTISVADGAKEIQEVWFGVYQNGSWVDDFQYSLNNGTTSIELSAAHDVATKANPADREPGDYEFSLLFVRYIGSNGEEYTIDDLHGVIAGFDYIVEDVGYGDGPTPTPTPGGTGLKGDAYEDGIINVADAMIIRQHIAGYSVPINMANADVNGDNIVNVADAMMIRQFIAYGTVFP